MNKGAIDPWTLAPAGRGEPSSCNAAESLTYDGCCNFEQRCIGHLQNRKRGLLLRQAQFVSAFRVVDEDQMGETWVKRADPLRVQKSGPTAGKRAGPLRASPGECAGDTCAPKGWQYTPQPVGVPNGIRMGPSLPRRSPSQPARSHPCPP